VGTTLMGVPFDAGRLMVTGSAVPLMQDVARASRSDNEPRDAHYAIAAGTLVWVSGREDENVQLVLSDPDGRLTPLVLPPGRYDTPRVSPDGRRLAVGVADPREAYIGIWDLDGRTALRRLTYGGHNRYPVWSRDGQHVTFQSDRDSDLGIFWQRADGSTSAERLTRPEPGSAHVPASWSPKDETLLFAVVSTRTTSDLGAVWTYTRPSGTTAPFGGVQGAAQSPVFSPDGRWVSYSVRTGGGAVPMGLFVEPFPATGARYQAPRLNPSPGAHSFWSPDGTRLFFAPGRDQMAVVTMTTQPTVAFGNPTLVPRQFSLDDRGPAQPRAFDIMPDGRILGLVAPRQPGDSRQEEIRIAINWFEELKRLVPTH
jgi:hypothetical protein